jgi:gas vesicle protein
MMRARTLLGVVIGGALVYFFDPRSGAERRERLRSRWEESREPILNTARETASAAQENVSQLGDQATAKVSELKSRVRKSNADPSAPYDTASAGTAGTREDTETAELPERFRTYEGQAGEASESGDLPAPR